MYWALQTTVKYRERQYGKAMFAEDSPDIKVRFEGHLWWARTTLTILSIFTESVPPPPNSSDLCLMYVRIFEARGFGNDCGVYWLLLAEWRKVD
jgi:hypothetical protein